MATTNSHASTDASDRRDYFRITDSIALRIDPVPHPEYAVQPPPELAAGHQLLRELQLMDNESATLLRNIHDKSRELGQYFKLINRKIELTARFYVLQQAATQYRHCEVMLSGSGIGFQQAQPIPMDSLVDLHFILLHTATAVSCRAKIVRCDPHDGGYLIGSEFVEINDVDRDAIVRHALFLEAARRREANS